MKYDSKEIKKDNNLIFDLKNDITFKRVFLNSNNAAYLKYIADKITNKKIVEKYSLINAEIPNIKEKKKSSYCDIVIKSGNYEYIIEMNGSTHYSDLTYYKNHHYLLKEHSSRNYNENTYGKNNYTILSGICQFNACRYSI